MENLTTQKAIRLSKVLQHLIICCFVLCFYTAYVQAQCTVTVKPVTICNLGGSGTLKAELGTACPGATYAWSNGDSGPSTTITLSTPADFHNTTYTVTVTCGVNTCTAEGVVITAPKFSFNTTNAICDEKAPCTGKIDLTVSDGLGPFTYLWSNGATTQDLTGLCVATPGPAKYFVTITDNSGCCNGTVINVNVKTMNDYAVFGGDFLCPNGPGQTPPPGSSLGSGCRVHMGVGSVINGNVGSYHFVEANGDVQINGNINSGGDVNLANGDKVNNVTAANGDVLIGDIFNTGAGASIFGNVDVNGNINVNDNGGSFIIGTVTHPVLTTYNGPIPLGGEVFGPPTLPTLPAMPAITSLTCPTGSATDITGTAVITPGAYGNIILGNGSGQTVTFSGPGNYYFNSIKMGQGPTHTFIYDFMNIPGNINIYVCGDVDMGLFDANFLNPSSEDACRIYFETHGDGSTNGGDHTYSFIIGAGSHFFGTVWAPYAGIFIGSGSCCTFATGHLWSATQVNVQHGVTINTCSQQCVYVDSIELPCSPPQCPITLSPKNDTTCVGTNAQLCANASVPAPDAVKYVWHKGPDSGPIVGGNTDCLNFPNVQLSDAGNYTVVVTSVLDPTNCFKEATLTLSVYDTLKITITKVLGNGSAAPATDWAFTTDLPAPNNAFTIPAAGGSHTITLGTFAPPLPGTPLPTSVCITETAVPNWNVTITPGLSPAGTWSTPTSNTACLSVKQHCSNAAVTFTNSTGCMWCNKLAIYNYVQGNLGNGCMLPDLLVDVRLGASYVHPEYAHTDMPSFGSITAAVNYITTHTSIAQVAGQLFVGVIATDETQTPDPNCPQASCTRPYAGDNPHGNENVIITNPTNYKLNVFGCSVTIWPVDYNLPVISVVNSIGPVSVMDLHVWKDNNYGYYINNNTGAVIVKNASAYYNMGYGYYIDDDNVTVTGAQHIDYNGIGIFIKGNNNTLNSLSEINRNTKIGVQIDGSGNTSGSVTIGDKNNANPIGMLISGSNNKVKGDKVNYNVDGIVVSGSGNTVDGETVEYNTGRGVVVSGSTNSIINLNHLDNNGSHGIYVTGANNILTSNQPQKNKGDGINANKGNGATGTKIKSNKSQNNTGWGIRACQQTDAGGNSASGNVAGQISFSCLSTRDEITSENSFEIYPNPTQGNATVTFNSTGSDKFNIKLVDMTGRIIDKVIIDATDGINSYELNLSNVAKGTYMIVLENSNSKNFKRIIVQ